MVFKFMLLIFIRYLVCLDFIFIEFVGILRFKFVFGGIGVFFEYIYFFLGWM